MDTRSCFVSGRHGGVWSTKELTVLLVPVINLFPESETLMAIVITHVLSHALRLARIAPRVDARWREYCKYFAPRYVPPSSSTSRGETLHKRMLPLFQPSRPELNLQSHLMPEHVFGLVGHKLITSSTKWRLQVLQLAPRGVSFLFVLTQ